MEYKSQHIFAPNSFETYADLFNSLLKSNLDNVFLILYENLKSNFDIMYECRDDILSNLKQIHEHLIFPSIENQSIVFLDKQCTWYYVASYGWILYNYCTYVDNISSLYNYKYCELVSVLCKLHFINYINESINLVCQNSQIKQLDEDLQWMMIEDKPYPELTSNQLVPISIAANFNKQVITVLLSQMYKTLYENAVLIYSGSSESQFFISSMFIRQLKITLLQKKFIINKSPYRKRNNYEFHINIIHDVFKQFLSNLGKNDLKNHKITSNLSFYYNLWTFFNRHYSYTVKKKSTVNEADAENLLVCIGLFGIINDKLNCEIYKNISNFSLIYTNANQFERFQLQNYRKFKWFKAIINGFQNMDKNLYINIPILSLNVILSTLTICIYNCMESISTILINSSKKVNYGLEQPMSINIDKYLNFETRITLLKNDIRMLVIHKNNCQKLAQVMKHIQKIVCKNLFDSFTTAKSLLSNISKLTMYEQFSRLMDIQIAKKIINANFDIGNYNWISTESRWEDYFPNVIEFIFLLERFIQFMCLIEDTDSSYSGIYKTCGTSNIIESILLNDKSGSLLDYFINQGNKKIKSFKQLDFMFIWHCFIIQLTSILNNGYYQVSENKSSSNNLNFIDTIHQFVVKPLDYDQEVHAILDRLPKIWLRQLKGVLSKINIFVFKFLTEVYLATSSPAVNFLKKKMLSKKNSSVSESFGSKKDSEEFQSKLFRTNSLSDVFNVFFSIPSNTINEIKKERISLDIVSLVLSSWVSASFNLEASNTRYDLINTAILKLESFNYDINKKSFWGNTIDLNVLQFCLPCAQDLCKQNIFNQFNTPNINECFPDKLSFFKVVDKFNSDCYLFLQALNHEDWYASEICKRSNTFSDSSDNVLAKTCDNCNELIETWIQRKCKSIVSFYRLLKKAFSLRMLNLIRPFNDELIEQNLANHIIFLVYLKLWLCQPYPFCLSIPTSTSLKIMGYTVFELSSCGVSLIEILKSRESILNTAKYSMPNLNVFSSFSNDVTIPKNISIFKEQKSSSNSEEFLGSGDSNDSVATINNFVINSDVVAEESNMKTDENYDTIDCCNEANSIVNILDQMGGLINDVLKSQLYISIDLVKSYILSLVDIHYLLSKNIIGDENSFTSNDSNKILKNRLINLSNCPTQLQSAILSMQMWPKSVLMSDNEIRSNLCDISQYRKIYSFQRISMTHPYLKDCNKLENIFSDSVKSYEKQFSNRTIEFLCESVLIHVELAIPIFSNKQTNTNSITITVNLPQYHIIKGLYSLKKVSNQAILEQLLEEYLETLQQNKKKLLPKCIRDNVSLSISNDEIADVLYLLHNKKILI